MAHGLRRTDRRFSTGSSPEAIILRQIAEICRTEELPPSSGSAFLLLGQQPYAQVNTEFIGGYQRITTWRDAFRSGATYGWSTHVEHSVTQSEPSYAGNLATLAGGGASVLTFDNSTCRYTVGGAFSAKTAHTIIMIEDVQATPAHAAIEFDCTNRTAFALGDNVDTKWYWYDGANECRSATFDRATGENLRGFVGDNADPTFTFYRGADSDTVSKGSTTVKAITGTVSLFNYLTGSFGQSAKRALFLYCSGKHPALVGVARILQSYLNDLTHPTAVAALNAIRAECMAEEAAGGSALLLLPGDWTIQQPISTLVDCLTAGVLPGVGYAGHTAHDATQGTEAYQAWTTTLPNGSGAIQFVAGKQRGYSLAGSYGTATSRSVALVMAERSGANQKLFVGTAPLYGQIMLNFGVKVVTYDGAWRDLGAMSTTLQTLSIEHNGAGTEAHLVRNGVVVAPAAYTPRAISGPISLGTHATECVDADISLLLLCTGYHPELHALVRRYAQLTAGAP